MPTCEKCNKFFKYNYLLTAHYRRKYPCVAFTEKGTNFTEKGTNLECQYCNQGFCRIDTKNYHEKTCKKKDDPIWKLESEIGIEHKIPRCDNECEYCRKEMSKANMKRHKETCREKLKYKERLEKYLENLKMNNKTNTNTNVKNITTEQVNNITNTNTTTKINRFYKYTDDDGKEVILAEEDMKNYTDLQFFELWLTFKKREFERRLKRMEEEENLEEGEIS